MITVLTRLNTDFAEKIRWEVFFFLAFFKWRTLYHCVYYSVFVIFLVILCDLFSYDIQMFQHYVKEYNNLQLIVDFYTPHPQCKWDQIWYNVRHLKKAKKKKTSHLIFSAKSVFNLVSTVIINVKCNKSFHCKSKCHEIRKSFTNEFPC
jgi:hypothetical protein